MHGRWQCAPLCVRHCSSLRGALADALRGIAALLRSPQSAATIRRQTIEALARADNFETLSRFELEMLQFRGKTCRMKGVGYVDGQVVAEAEMMAMVTDK